MLAIIVTSILGVVLFFIVVAGIIASSVSELKSDSSKLIVKDNSVLLIDMQSQIREQTVSNSFAFFSAEEGPGLYDVVKSIQKAKTDDKIKGIVLKLNPSPNGMATLQQVRNAIKDFKGSGKFVYAYGEYIPQNAYYVATAADSIYLNPVGEMELKGYATVLAFFKGSLNKLEVEPEIFYAGKFKSATEPFRTTQMSEANKKQVAEFQQDFWTEFTQAVAERTGTDTSEVTALARSGAIEFPKDALEHHLVDGLWYSDQINGLIRKKVGADSDDDWSLVAIGDYAKKLSNSSAADDKVAVLYAEGAIVSGKSEGDDFQVASQTMVETIRKIRKDDNIKAVVMRVNSPGGSALASEVILRELQLLQKDKKLVVSMGDVAASGGYYISCYADSIFVMPNTITGSIGVYSMMFNIEKMMNNKLGVTFDGVKNAPYADFPSGIRPLTADEKARMQNSVNHIYDIFKNHVAKGRNMDVSAVDEIAQGRVWSGTAAIKNGLADAYGDIDRSIESAATLAGLESYKVVRYPESIDQFERLLKRMKGTEMSASVKEDIRKTLEKDYPFVKQLRLLKQMNGQTMAMMPFDISIK